ncbi:hypothetical protein [Limosilactobacillus reuteri]|uniref:Uncharacterized protein n=1 Tax=Limosilactobacillus reuteri TaxID=1598 RepID=A0AAJ1I8F3_LIMRT|nr:hypothetical protein [Limosilactobacillus reuteri]MCC4466866.1 hypothetical protein [Limosilactobacillus reuteri]MCC4472888.1 hypothetical protein [Limosilactobacillus reuteri]MCH5378435.1 hypothetical protein [Limosilactobacillus reuteri]MDC6077574.1 hypothetical protein [Limosilactobacillus reuteri]OCW70573.1 hypothetical protein BBP14_10280 [Limosilactobacillus reuteri]
MVSEAQKEATKKYRAENPLKKTYWDRKGQARGFITVDLKRNTKLAQAINENRIQYINDLKELQGDIQQRLKDLQQ